MKTAQKAQSTKPNSWITEHKYTHPTKNYVAQQFAVSAHDKLDQKTIDKNVDSILAADTAYGAKGSVASLVFYMSFQVEMNSGGRIFNGKAWGVSFPGGGALFGDVYTDDLDRLYNETESFQFTGTPVYFSIVFFDAAGNVLGTFQAGALSTVIGTGGGGGSWS